MSSLMMRALRLDRFQALLRYLYTGEIGFAPWGSAERRDARAREKISWSYGIPRPSPKSIYRLADKVKVLPYGLCRAELTLSSVRYSRVEAARVAADPERLIQVRHNRGSF